MPPPPPPLLSRAAPAAGALFAVSPPDAPRPPPCACACSPCPAGGTAVARGLAALLSPLASSCTACLIFACSCRPHTPAISTRQPQPELVTAPCPATPYRHALDARASEEPHLLESAELERRVVIRRVLQALESARSARPALVAVRPAPPRPHPFPHHQLSSTARARPCNWTRARGGKGKGATS
jgi:hypothetical protein